MKKIYLDNAATTPMRPEVIQEMIKVMTEDFGNPSSTHSFGRSAKNTLELSRKTIAKCLHATAQEIIFTSGATEANNWILRTAIRDLGVKRIVTSRVEHHAVLHAVEMLEQEFGIQVDYVSVGADGSVNLTHLVTLLSDGQPTLVSLMHVNNETGAVLDLHAVSRICKQHEAYFHSDTVQSVGKINFDLQELPIDFIVASAHKFHGPKGVGFAFVRKGLVLHPVIFGGEQEKGLRPGTESIHNIAGMAKALELSYEHLDQECQHISELKSYLLTSIRQHFPEIKVNGGEACFYNIINLLLPFSPEKTAMILFQLDIKGIAVSRGSACQSGSQKPSHVLAQMLQQEELVKPSLRVSFSHYNTKEEIDEFVTVLASL